MKKKIKWFDDRTLLLAMADRLEKLGGKLHRAIRYALANYPDHNSFIVDFEAGSVKASVSVGNRVRIIGGRFESFEGTVDEVDKESLEASVQVPIFGRQHGPIWFNVLLLERVSS